MKDSHFDHWTRSLTSFDSSRRAVSKALAAGALSALLAHAGREETAAKCVAPGKKCKSKQGRKRCCGGAKCRGKRCRCPGGADAACGKRCCPPGQICVGGGVCVTGSGSCPAGANTCEAGFPIFCNNSDACACYQRIQGGTRCGQPTSLTDLDQCTSDTDCLDLGFPAGSSCIRDDAACLGTNPARGACAAPCGLGGFDATAPAFGDLLQP